MVFNVTDTLCKPNYDVANYGQDISLNLGTQTGALQEVTMATANFEQSGDTATENLQDGTEVRQLFDNYVNCSLSALTGTGANVFIAHLEGIAMTKIANSNVVKLRIRIDETVSGTNTRQVGLFPLFPFQKTATMKQWTTSVFDWHVHPTLDHAFQIFRDQSVQNLIDYSGVTIQGQTRGTTVYEPMQQQVSQVQQSGNTGVLIG